MRLDGKTAIVTGAGGGLGRSHALLLASLGAAVVVNDLGSAVSGENADQSRAQAVAEEIHERGGRAVANTASVATPEGAATLASDAIAHFGRLDIVVNNAGVLKDFPMSAFDLSAWQTVLNVHLNGTMFVTSAAWPHLMQNGGSIISTTSATALFGNDGQAAYGAAKAGIVGLTRCWAVEGASHGIRANAIAPLAVTRMTDRTNPDRVTGIERTTASDVIGDVFARLSTDQVSPLVAWLSHQDCTDTGSVYSVGGGRVARVATVEAEGWTDPAHDVVSLQRNWQQINRVIDTIHEPRSLLEEFAIYAEALGGNS